MQVSLNTAVFLPQLEHSKSQLACLLDIDAWPIDNIEVRGEFFAPATKTQELEQIAKLCQKNNWGLYYSVPEELFLGDHFAPKLEKQLALAEKIGIKNLKYSLGHIDLLFSDAKLKQLHALLANSPINVTIENQPNVNGKLSAITQELAFDRSEKLSLGYTFDSGNWYWIDEDPTKAFLALRDQISVFHLKDIHAKQTVLLGKGDTDWQPMLKSLKTDVPVFLEYGTADLDELASQVQLVNRLLEN